MTPLRITAHLVNGYVARDPWSPALDGILAARVMQDRLGFERYTLNGAGAAPLAPVLDLPLAVELDGDDWWYCASCPRPVGSAGTELRPYHRRFDDQHERHLAGSVKRVMTAAGPYKSTRLHTARTVCRALEWHAIGDADAIRALLARVQQVGGRRGIGFGEVRAWRVDLDGDADLARLWRPLPLAYAERHGIAGQRLLRGLVPPVRLNPVECVAPLA